MPIKVLLVDDHPLFRKGLRTILESNRNIQIIGEVSCGTEAIDFVDMHYTDTIIMDVAMPNMNGIEATKTILSKHPLVRIIGLSLHNENYFVRGMLSAGAQGYLLKENVPEEILKAINKVAKNEMYICSEVTSTALKKEDSISIKPLLLKTKLYRPQTPDSYVERAGLIEYLESNIDKRVSVIVAPAGYGKSSLVGQWLDKTNFVNAWINTDASLNNLNLFLMYILEAVKQIFPKSLVRFSKLLRNTKHFLLKDLVHTFINEVEHLQQKFILVLDDYHYVKNPSIHEFINELIRFSPKNLHLVLISRNEIPFQLKGFQINGEMIEISMNDLQFSNSEIKCFFKKKGDYVLSDEIAKGLQFITEGWVVGLRTARSMIEKSKPFEKQFIEFDMNHQLISDYLFSEVISNHSTNFIEHIQIATLLNRFNSELLGELFKLNNKKNAYNGKDFLSEIIRLNLFVVQVNDMSRWYRFHPIFKNFIQNQIPFEGNQKIIKNYHKKAASLYEKEGFIDEAIRHATLIPNNKLCLDIIVRNQNELLINEKWEIIKNLLEIIPEMILKKNPTLLILKVYYLIYLGKFNNKVISLIDQIGLLLDEFVANSSSDATLLGSFYVLKAMRYWQDFDALQTLIYTKKASKVLPYNAQFFKITALQLTLLANYKQHNYKTSKRILNNALHDQINYTSKIRSKLYLNGCVLNFIYGNLDKVKVYALKSLRCSKEQNLKDTESKSALFLASVHFLKNEIEEAETYICKIYQNRNKTDRITFANCAFIKALIEAYKGNIKNSYEILEAAKEFLRETIAIDSQLSNLFLSIKIEILLIENNSNLDLKRLDYNNFMDSIPSWSFYQNKCTQIKYLIAINEVKLAEVKVKKLIESSKRTKNNYLLINGYILDAILLYRNNKEEEAVISLKSSLKIAEKGWYIQPYRNYGKPLLDLFNKLPMELTSNSYIQSIYKEIRKELFKKTNDIKEKITQGQTFLSIRELEIIKYVEKGMRNKEIAHVLNVSNYTIKKHLYNTYQKLGVNNRMALIKRLST